MGRTISFRINEILYAHISQEVTYMIEKTLPTLLDKTNLARVLDYSKTMKYNMLLSIRLNEFLKFYLEELKKRYSLGYSTSLRLAFLYYHMTHEKTTLKMLLPAGTKLKYIVAGKKTAWKGVPPPEVSFDGKKTLYKVYFYLDDLREIKKFSRLFGMSVEEYLYRHIIYQSLRKKEKFQVLREESLK